jgi:hypothetical protein
MQAAEGIGFFDCRTQGADAALPDWRVRRWIIGRVAHAIAGVGVVAIVAGIDDKVLGMEACLPDHYSEASKCSDLMKAQMFHGASDIIAQPLLAPRGVNSLF